MARQIIYVFHDDPSTQEIETDLNDSVEIPSSGSRYSRNGKSWIVGRVENCQKPTVAGPIRTVRIFSNRHELKGLKTVLFGEAVPCRSWSGLGTASHPVVNVLKLGFRCREHNAIAASIAVSKSLSLRLSATLYATE
jgi:hypothetical protein